MKIMRWLALAAAVWGWCATPAQAGVHGGYLCSATFIPAAVAQGYGADGYLVVSVNPSPDCIAGGTAYSVWFCSAGSTQNMCSSKYVYTASSLSALAQSAVQAVAHNVRVNAWTDSTCVAADYCGAYLEFRAN
jgi:hypothetical protein